MNIDEQLQQMAGTNNPVLVELATRANYLKNALQQGQCSPDEYVGMVKDLVREANIDEAISDMQTRQATYQVLSGLLALASVAG